MEKDLVWQTVDNSTAEKTLKQHCYHDTTRRRHGEYYQGSRTLCNSKIGISEDGETYSSVQGFPSEDIDKDNCCKTCLNIFTKIENGHYSVLHG